MLIEIRSRRQQMKGIKAVGAAGLVFLVATAAPVWAAGNDDGPRATASAGKVSKQLKSLQKRIAALESKPSPTGAAPSGAATGPAGGALTGAYPNPGLAVNSVGSDQIAPNAVGSSEVTTSAISSAEVEDGSLNGADVGKAAGTQVGFDPGAIQAGSCLEIQVTLNTTENLTDDAFAVTMGADWSSNLSVTTEASNQAGQVRLDVCNNGTLTINQDPVDFYWVAFDV
jgi:hypothetical protein